MQKNGFSDDELAKVWESFKAFASLEEFLEFHEYDNGCEPQELAENRAWLLQMTSLERWFYHALSTLSSNCSNLEYETHLHKSWTFRQLYHLANGAHLADFMDGWGFAEWKKNGL
jgi:hypothetical protein